LPAPATGTPGSGRPITHDVAAPGGGVTDVRLGELLVSCGTLREAGAATMAQDEQSSPVSGMPKEAIRLGAVNTVLPLSRIAQTIVDFGG